MSKPGFSLIKTLFGGGKLSPEKKQELFAETMFMVLSGATRADLHIESVEVTKVKSILDAALHKSFTEEEIKLAGETELYDVAPIQKYVANVSKKLDVGQRQQILNAMVEVFKSDGRMGVLETKFFNDIAGALSLTPAQMLGLSD